MRHTLHLPALDGRDALGFLAALGLLRLLTEHGGPPVELSFCETTAEARLHGTYATCDDVVTQLSTIVALIPADGVIPDLPATFPTAKTGTKGGDPARPPHDQYRRLIDHARTVGGDTAVRWQAAIVSDLGIDDKSRAALTPYTAPAGQQTIRSFFEKALQLVRADPAHLLHALTGWRRVPGFTGEYFDHRVIRAAVDTPSGESSEIGVPGATWLAIMALPLLRLTGDGKLLTATLWRRTPRQPSTMIWPLWRQALDLAGAITLIEHPAIALQSSLNGGDLRILTNTWPSLGIFAIAAAQRRPVEGRQSAGVLTPVTVTTGY